MQYLIDASVYVFRAHFSMPDDMVDDNGNPINALYGFCRFLGDFLEQVKPEYVAVLFDESLTTSFRSSIYPAYKANREPAPPELKRQFEQCRRYAKAIGVMQSAHPQYEADDLIGTLVSEGHLFNMAWALCIGLVLFLFFKYTKQGIAMRAVTDDPETAKLMGIPVRFIGTGEKIGDLAPFDAEEFVGSLLN